MDFANSRIVASSSGVRAATPVWKVRRTGVGMGCCGGGCAATVVDGGGASGLAPGRAGIGPVTAVGGGVLTMGIAVVEGAALAATVPGGPPGGPRLAWAGSRRVRLGTGEATTAGGCAAMAGGRARGA